MNNDEPKYAPIEDLRVPDAHSSVDIDNLSTDTHDGFQQQGTYIVCTCHGHAAGIPAGKILTYNDGQYSLQDMQIISSMDKSKH